MSKLIPLTKGMSTIVDDEDFDFLMLYRWHAQAAPRGYSPWRAATGIGGKTILMHRMLLQAQSHERVDHTNGNALDNQRLNLRIATHQQNMQNAGPRRHENSASDYKGVGFHPKCRTRPWFARIQVDRKEMRLGYFATEREAAEAYDEAARIHHGIFARTNF